VNSMQHADSIEELAGHLAGFLVAANQPHIDYLHSHLLHHCAITLGGLSKFAVGDQELAADVVEQFVKSQLTRIASISEMTLSDHRGRLRRRDEPDEDAFPRQ
jgi:hypothetical protein